MWRVRVQLVLIDSPKRQWGNSRSEPGSFSLVIKLCITTYIEPTMCSMYIFIPMTKYLRPNDTKCVLAVTQADLGIFLATNYAPLARQWSEQLPFDPDGALA